MAASADQLARGERGERHPAAYQAASPAGRGPGVPPGQGPGLGPGLGPLRPVRPGRRRLRVRRLLGVRRLSRAQTARTRVAHAAFPRARPSSRDRAGGRTPQARGQAGRRPPGPGREPDRGPARRLGEHARPGRAQAERPAQLRRELPAGPVPVGGREGQRPAHHLVGLGGQPLLARAQQGRRRGDLGVDRGRARLAAHRRRPGEQLERHGGQRVLVGPAVRRAAGELLGRGVVEGARPQPRQARVGQRLRAQPEPGQVGEVRLVTVRPRVQQQAGGPQVAVHQAAGVHGVQRRGRLRDDLRRPARRQRALALQQGADVSALGQPHGDEQRLAFLADFEHRDDVRVADGGRRPPFLRVAGPEPVVPGQPRGQDPQRDPPVQPGRVGAVHGRQRPLADSLLQPVAGHHRACRELPPPVAWLVAHRSPTLFWSARPRRK